MTDLQRHACGPCQKDHHHQCRDGEWGGCPCPHPRGLTPVPAPASTPANQPPSAAARADAAGVEGAAGAWGSAPVAPFPRPLFWGERGCRHADEPGHVCRLSNGMPVEPGQCCFDEAKSALAEMHPAAVGVPITGVEDVAARLAEKLGTLGRAVGQ